MTTVMYGPAPWPNNPRPLTPFEPEPWRPAIEPSTPVDGAEIDKIREAMRKATLDAPPALVTREEFAKAMESIRAGLREIEAKLDETSAAKTLRFALNDAERLRAENSKWRRLKGWRLRYEYLTVSNHWLLATVEVESTARARQEARACRRDPANFRNVRLVRVYRKERS